MQIFSNLFVLLFFFTLLSCNKTTEIYQKPLENETDFDSTTIVVKDSTNGVVYFEKPVDSAALKLAEEKKLIEEEKKKAGDIKNELTKKDEKVKEIERVKEMEKKKKEEKVKEEKEKSQQIKDLSTLEIKTEG